MTVPDDLVEQVARAIYEKMMGICVDADWAKCDGPARELYLDLARAAIIETLRGIREIDDIDVAQRMHFAGEAAFKHPDNQHGGILDEVYRGMIDQLIKEIEASDA